MPRVLFIDGTPGFSPSRRKDAPCGGILNSLDIIPKYLAKKGWSVTVKSTYPVKETCDGVEYSPNSDPDAIPKWDVTVLNRNGINNRLVGYSRSIGAKVVWWLHDIVDFRYLDDGAFRYADRIIALSNYCRESFSRFYDLPLDRFAVIPNGVDKSVFYPGPYGNRKKGKLLMASALIKGYAPVADTWVNLRRALPDASLTIYSNQSLHGLANNDAQTAWLTEMEALGARVQQPVPQAILADKMRESWALLMPNSYPEICSNLMLQAMACGLPVVSATIGSASEFITNGSTGILTDYAPHDFSLWIKAYAEATIKLCLNDGLHQQISQQAPSVPQSWDEIGEKWHEELTRLV